MIRLQLWVKDVVRHKHTNSPLKPQASPNPYSNYHHNPLYKTPITILNSTNPTKLNQIITHTY